MGDYTYPDERKVNILLLIYTVVEGITVEEAFEFLVRGKEVGYRKINNDDIVYYREVKGLTFTEIAQIYNCEVSTITRRYRKTKGGSINC